MLMGFQETRTADRVNELLATYQPSPIADELRAELRDIVTKAESSAWTNCRRCHETDKRRKRNVKRTFDPNHD